MNLLAKIGFERKPILPCGLPTYEQFLLVFPARLHIDFDALAGPFPTERRRPDGAEAEDAEASGGCRRAIRHGDGPVGGSKLRRRLRSKTNFTA